MTATNNLSEEGGVSRPVCNTTLKNSAPKECHGNERHALTTPSTPTKTSYPRLDFSTPRLRYGGKRMLPMTPEQTPTKNVKRSATHAFEEELPSSLSSKRRHTDPEMFSVARSLIRRDSIPKFSILYQTETPKVSQFSADELKRTCEAVLRQVDWYEVQEYVASNRRAATYRRAVKSILQAEVDRLFEVEENGDNSD